MTPSASAFGRLRADGNKLTRKALNERFREKCFVPFVRLCIHQNHGQAFSIQDTKLPFAFANAQGLPRFRVVLKPIAPNPFVHMVGRHGAIQRQAAGTGLPRIIGEVGFELGEKIARRVDARTFGLCVRIVGKWSLEAAFGFFAKRRVARGAKISSSAI